METQRRAMLCIGLIVLLAQCSWAQKNYYTVTIPNKILANSDYVVACTYHGFPTGDSSPLNILVSIKKNDYSFGNVQATKGVQATRTVSVAPGTTQQLTIKIGDWPSGNYAVTINGSGPITFTDSENVNLVSKSFSTFIQTDKALYQPSQLVQFRVILVNPDLLPYQQEPLTVQIKDPQDNIIQQWDNVQLDRGLFQESLQLSDQPVMGDFSIIAQVGNSPSNSDKITTVKFTVQEYVLPQFQVTIDTPYVTFDGNNDPTFTITTTAKYTFGGPVNGNLDLSVDMAFCPYNTPYYYPYWYCGWNFEPQLSCSLKSVKVKVPINGTTTTTVTASQLYDRTITNPDPVGPIALTRRKRIYCPLEAIAKRNVRSLNENDHQALDKRTVNGRLTRRILPVLPPTSTSDTYRDTTVNIVAIVTEGLTAIQQNQTAAMTIYAKDKKLTISKPTTYKPGMPFQVTVTLTRQDNTPVTNSNGQVKLNAAFTSTPSSTTDQTMALSQSGVAVFTVNPPLNSTKLDLTATYNTITETATVNAAKSKTTKFISINVKTTKPQVGQQVDLEVTTTFGMNAPLAYVVVGRGDIRASGTLTPNGQSTVQFSFPVTSLMAPHMRIVVYYIDSVDGEMVADSLDVNVDGTFRTQVSLSTNATMLNPGDDVMLTIKTRPDSLVALQAVDMSVLLMKVGNDITQTKVFNELQNYDVGNGVIFNNNFDIGFWRRPDYGGTFQQIFQYAGLLVITNGNYYVEPFVPIWYERWPIMMDGIADGGMMARPMAMALNSVADEGAVNFEKSTAPEAPSSPSTNVEPTRVRTLFPETFIWATMNSTSDGSVLVTYSVPDTITTWVINAYALNNKYGLGIMDQSKNITVYRPFFIVINLPYSVIRNEILTVQVLVFNYQPQTSQVQVTLSNMANEYKIVAPANSDNQINVTITQQAQAGGATAFTFRIQPTVVGQINLNVKATSPTAGDALIKQLLVKAEGSTEFYNKAVMIDLRNTQTFSTQVQVIIPAEAIKNSEHIEFSAIGDFMAPVLSNIKELIRMPSGCGEQNMINFVPDVVIMRYLQSTSSLTQDIKDTLLNYLLQGYQRELTYKHTDGSYSAFGQSDSSGSTWLTAFVLKSFTLASPYITIDPNVIRDAKSFLVKQQQTDGQFKEAGTIIHQTLQGGSASGAGLTAFCLIAFLEDKTQDNTASAAAITNAVTYLEGLLDSITSVYDLSIVTYALLLAPNSLKKDKAFQLLQSKKTQAGDLTYWQSSATVPSGTYSYYNVPSTYDVEATSYALLCYALRNQTEASLPVLRWLISKRNSLGGYSSSQDTVIGIQALATVGASFKGVPGSSINIKIDYDGSSQSYTLNKQNALVVQKTPLPKTVRTVSISAQGSGVAIAQLSWNYNVFIKDAKQSFEVIPKILSSGNQSYSLQVCTKYLGSGTTNMVLIGINTLSSYKWDTNSVPAAGSQTGLERNELTNDNTLVTFYFDAIPTTSTCVVVNAQSTGDVSNLQDAKVSVYDYYATYKKGEAYYNLPK